jgi:hypothetical protein
MDNAQSSQKTNQLDYQGAKSIHGIRYASELSLQEQALLRAEFAPVLAAWHRHIHRACLILLIPLALFFLTVFLGVACVGILPLIIMIALYPLLRPPTLCCPHCRNRIGKSFGLFCPECGKRALSEGNFLIGPSCDACGKVMRNSRYTSYTTHACTHCGLWLDDEGI